MKNGINRALAAEKKIFTLFLSLVVNVGIMFASDTKVDGIWYDFNSSTQTASVTYRGVSYSSFSDEYSGSVSIPSSVTYNYVTYSVTSVGDEAFRGCTGLTSVTIPNSVTSIGNSAFAICTGLTSVTCVRETPANLGNDVFYAHANLKIYVPAGSVGTYKTAWAAYDDKIKAIPPAWLREGDDWDYATKTLTVNSDLPEEAYKGQTEIKHVIISNSVTSIVWAAFYDCTGLTSVTIGNSVTSIGAQAFALCTHLTSIEIPSSVTIIGMSAFGHCTNLESVTILAESLEWYGLLAFQATAAALKIYVPAGSVNAYKAGWYTYADKIKAIPAPAPEWVRAGDEWDADTKTLTVNSNLPNAAYMDQTVIKNLVISDAVTSIGESAFSGCDSLTSVTIPSSVTSIEGWAFAACASLTSVTIPNDVTSIGYGAFFGCTGLTSIVVTSGNTTYDSRENCNAIIETSSNKLIVGCKNTIIPNSVTSIGAGAFAYCTGLTSITIPNGVTSIGDNAFAVCTGLTSVTIPNSVTSIGAGAFVACIGLTSIEIPNSVEYIGAEAFAGCSGLTSITIPNSVDSIGDYTFAVCSGLTSITIPNSVKSIGDSAFMMCSNLESVTCVRETPASLGNNAFNECSNLNAIYVPCGTLGAYQSSWTQYQSYIQYAQPEYTIIGNVNIAGAGTVILPQTICDNSITASPNYGYHFVQWSDGVTENPRTIELTQDTTFTATFAKNTYSITKNAVNGSIAGLSQAEYLDEVTLTATPNYGYHFVQWSDGVTENPRAFVLTQDTTFTAEFAYEYTITINESSHGSVVASSSSAAAGETITLTATPDDGYQLKSISGVYLPAETLNATSETVNGNKFQAQATSRNLYGWRVYNPGTANTLTVSSLNGTTLIEKIEFTSAWDTDRKNNMLSVSAGTLSFDGNDPSTTVTINDINATSVTISGSGDKYAKTWYISSVKVYTEEVLEISDTENANVKTFTMVDGEVTISAEFVPVSEPTAIENVQTNHVQAIKFFRDGMLFIEKNGKIYNATGAEVK